MTRLSALWTVVAAIALFSVPPADAQKPRQRAELVYVANQSADTVAAYSIRQGGALLGIAGSPFAAGGSPNSVAVVPSGRFVYVADVIPGGISGFSVSETGAVTPIPGSPFPAATGTVFVTSDPSGRFLYALNCGSDCSSSGAGDIEAFTLDQQTGVLTTVAGSPFLAGNHPYSLAVDPTGHFAYVASADSGEVYAFAVDSQSGALTQVGMPIAAGTRPLSVAVDPWGEYVYAADTGLGNVWAFAINFDGSLSSVKGAPFAAGAFTSGVTVSANGRFVLVSAGPGVYVYSIDSVGALHLLAESPVAAGTGPRMESRSIRTMHSCTW